MAVNKLTLGDLALDEDEFTERLFVTRLRIIGVFRRATEPDMRRLPHYKGAPRFVKPNAVRSSGNAIVSCGDGKISTLAGHVLRELPARNPMLVTEDVKPDSIRRIKPKLVERELYLLQHELISHVLCEMRENHQIYFMEGDGIWQAHQSVVDEYLTWREAGRKVRPDGNYVNSRPFHGRVRSQAIRRGTPPGTSIGISKQSRGMTG